MSAILMTCSRCGATYLAGVVGTTPWPAHQCANAHVVKDLSPLGGGPKP